MPLSEYVFGGIMSIWNIKQTEEFQDWFDKAGSGDKTFYDKMIDQSEKIYGRYLEERKKEIMAEQKKLDKQKKEPSKNLKKGKKK
jgi:hypothetical protein